MSSNRRITYISICNAIAIIAVIIGHLDITGPSNDPNTPIANIIASFGNFQMPLFMCVSGFLFSMTSGFSKSYSLLIKSKVKRLVIPFLSLSLFTFAFKLCLPANMLEHAVGLSWQYLFKLFCIPFRGPVPHLWFVISLFSIFLLSPLYKWSVNKKCYSCIMLLVLFILHLWPTMWKASFELFSIDKTLVYLFWFYFGILIQKHHIDKKINSSFYLISCGLLYTILTYWIHIPFLSDICMMLGIFFVFSLSMKIEKKYEKLFSSWRDYTYQIYLLHMFPIMACKYLYNRHLLDNETIWFSLCWILGLTLAIIIPTIVSKFAQKLPQKYSSLIGL